MANDPQTDREPVVDPDTLKFRRAIRDPKEAYTIGKRLVQENRDRNQKAADITRKLNDAQPWSPKRLAAANQSWRHNRSTGFMSGIVKRVLPNYRNTIEQAPVLTNSKLSEDSPAADEKTKVFREEITRTIRDWEDWDDFIDLLLHENLVFGYEPVNWSDEFSWRPSASRQDEVLFPDGTGQKASAVPAFLKIQYFHVHELADKLESPEEAEEAGWNIENLVKSINMAKPENRRTGTTEDKRRTEDTFRETTVGISLSLGVKKVKVYHLFIQEYNGKVSHYMNNGDNGDVLYVSLDRFESMSDILSIFTVEVGNGKVHGSKGIGRILYNTHVAIEQARNLIADNLYLSGLLLLKAKSRNAPAIAVKVAHPFAVVNEEYDVIDQKFQANVDAFFQLDRHMQQIAEIQAGAFIPSVVTDKTGKARSASEINFIASVEQEIKEGVITRFFRQFQGMISVIQRRICTPDNVQMAMIKVQQSGLTGRVTKALAEFLERIDERIPEALGLSIDPTTELDEEEMAAVDCIVRMMNKGLTVKDIVELCNSTAKSTIRDLLNEKASGIAAIAASYRGDPDVDQMKLKHKDIASKSSDSEAQDLLIPREDNTIVTEQTRLQILELGELLRGESVPLSPRDDDMIHLGVIAERAQELFASVNPNAVTPETVPLVQVLLDHTEQHIEQARAKGIPDEALGEFQTLLDQVKQDLGIAQEGLETAPQANAPEPGVVPAVAGGIPDVGTGAEPEVSNAAAATRSKPLSRGGVDLTVQP